MINCKTIEKTSVYELMLELNKYVELGYKSSNGVRSGEVQGTNGKTVKIYSIDISK